MAQWEVANRIEQINGESGFIQTVDSISLLANAVNQTVNYRIRETDFLWTAAVAVSTGIFSTRAECKTENRFLDSAPVCSENFWGTAQSPFKHPPKFFPLNGEIVFSFNERSGTPNTVQLFLWGKRAETCTGNAKTQKKCRDSNCKCDRGMFGQGRGLFVLHTGIGGVSIPAGSVTSNPLKAPDYYHLRICAINAAAYNATVGTTPLANGWKGYANRMDPRDERNAYISNAQMQAAGWTGTATAPARLPSPIVLHKASQIECDYTDLVNNGAATIVNHAFVCEAIDDDVLDTNG
jgi:hypothetical protein